MVYNFSHAIKQPNQPDMHADAVDDIIRENEITPLYLTYRADYKAQTSQQGYAIGNLSTLFPREKTKPITINNITQLLLRQWIAYPDKPTKLQDLEPHAALATLFDTPRFTANHITDMAYNPKVAISMRLAKKLDMRFGMGALLQKTVKRNRKYGDSGRKTIDLPFQCDVKDYNETTHGALLHKIYKQHKLTSQELARYLKADSTRSPKILSYMVAQTKNPDKYGLNNPPPTLDGYYSCQLDKKIFGLDDGPFSKIFQREKARGTDKSKIVTLRHQARQAKVHCPEFFSYAPHQLGKIRKYNDLANTRSLFYETLAEFTNDRVTNPLQFSQATNISLQACMGWGPPTQMDISNAYTLQGLKKMEPDQQAHVIAFFQAAIKPITFSKFHPQDHYTSVPELYKSYRLWDDEHDNSSTFTKGIEETIFDYFLEQKTEFGNAADEKILEKGDLRVFSTAAENGKKDMPELYIHRRLIDAWEDQDVLRRRFSRSSYEDVPY